MHKIFNYMPNYITLQAMYICIHIRPILAREEFVKYTSTNITQKLFFSRLHSQAAKLKFSTHSNEIFVKMLYSSNYKMLSKFKRFINKLNVFREGYL